eukprot:scaffold101314_cov28-Tisochrysis_lutea.AAC.1
MVAATPFGSTRRTGCAIDAITSRSLQRHGIKWRDGGSVHEAVHGKVSDNGSNMVKRWSGFNGGFCAAHAVRGLKSSIF